MYSLDLTIELMKVCAKYELHFIVDEIYALSIHNHEKGSFQSVLTIPRSQVNGDKKDELILNSIQLPDSQRTHFLWGLSKDLGLAGFRMGFIHTYNTVSVEVLSRDIELRAKFTTGCCTVSRWHGKIHLCPFSSAAHGTHPSLG